MAEAQGDRASGLGGQGSGDIASDRTRAGDRAGQTGVRREGAGRGGAAASADALSCGARVRVRWAEETRGHIRDIHCFDLVGG